MSWVLIFFLFTGNAMSQSTSVYATEAACEAAARRATEAVERISWFPRIAWTCNPTELAGASSDKPTVPRPR